jgi:CubicO group peptidase (beta-lactamase class C family)
MSFVTFTRAATFALCAAVAGAGIDAQPVVAANADVTQALTAAVTRGDTPGVVGLVVDRDRVVYEGAAGKLDATGTALGVDAIFNIASMTKPVTSVAVMMLIEQGKIRLDDPVSKFLPGFDNLEVIAKFNDADGSYETRPAKRPMTIRHLLTNTSGIAYGFCNPIVERLQRGNHKREWELPLLSDPGDQWHYSPSTRVLGLIVEKVGGETLEAFFQSNIFHPLGMADTSYAVPPDKLARVIAVYQHADGQFKPSTFRTLPSALTPPYTGDGGLYSTARDYGQFLRMLLNGGRLGSTRILSRHSVLLMEQNQIGPIFVEQQPTTNPQLSQPFPLGAGRDKFGLGFEIAAAHGDDGAQRSAGRLSWAGIYNTEFWIDPKRGIGGVLLMQYLPFYDPSALRTLTDFEAAAYRHVVPRPR